MLESEIHKFNFRPPNPHTLSLAPSLSLSLAMFSRIQILSHIYFFSCSNRNVVRKPTGFWYFFPHHSVITPTSMKNRYGLKADPWCNSTSTLKLPLSPAALRTFVWEPIFMSCTAREKHYRCIVCFESVDGEVQRRPERATLCVCGPGESL